MMKRKAEYWCSPQKGGHLTLYFHGHRQISRADYVEAVGPDDCDPHVGQGARKKKAMKQTRSRRAGKAHRNRR
jgi:hypothetical protein